MSLHTTFRALADPTRRHILELLKKKDMPVSDIAAHFTMTLPSLSHHLSILKQAGLIISERSGQQIIYSLNLSVFEEISQEIMALFKTTKS